MVGGMLTLERAAVTMYGRRPTQPPLQLASKITPLSTIPAIEPGAHMQIQENGILLRVFIGKSDRYEHKPLYEMIVQKVRQLGLAGAAVLRGTEGFGAHSTVHKSALLELSSDLPIVIEVIDSEAKIQTLLPHLETIVTEGMVTMEHVMILTYRHGRTPKSQPGASS